MPDTPSSQSEILDKINDIEREFDVWSIKYDGIAIWPLLRLRIFDLYFNKPVIPNGNASNSAIKQTILKKFRHFFAHLYWITKTFLQEYRIKAQYPLQDKENNYKTLSKSNFLLYGISTHRSLIIEGRYFNRITDSFDYFLSPKGTTIHLESIIDQPSFPRFKKSFIIDHLLIKSEYFRNLKSILFNKHLRVENYNAFQAYLTKKGIAFYDEKTIIDHSEKIIAHKIYFKKVLQKVQPGLIFLDIFYHDKAMALILAAKELKITAIEIQHGVQGPDHVSYGRWVHYPSEGSCLMPDYFWSWDEYSYNTIHEWCKDSLVRPVLGGNTLLSIIKNNIITFDISPELSLKLKHYKRVILISLSNTMEGECNSLKLISKLIQTTLKDTLWVFRYHPGYITKNKQILSEIIADIPKENILIHSPSEINLYSLLKHVNFHITTISTVCMEAQSYGIKNIILGEEGYSFYKNYITSGFFFHARSGKELIALLDENELKPNEEIIKTDAEVIDQQIDFLLTIPDLKR